jgi:hypothetical protein
LAKLTHLLGASWNCQSGVLSYLQVFRLGQTSALGLKRFVEQTLLFWLKLPRLFVQFRLLQGMTALLLVLLLAVRTDQLRFGV